MWVQLLCGLVVYRVVKRFFYDDPDDDDQISDFNALFSVAQRLEKLYGGKAYVGLQVPDADTATRQTVDILLITQLEAVMICVKNISGFVAIDKDGNWVCAGGHKHKTQHLSDPVADAKGLVPILESYLEQRGVALPEGYLSAKVICPNPNFSTIHSVSFPPEVVTYDQWMQLTPQYKNMLSGWIKGAFRGGKKEFQESIYEKLNFILSTAPTSDRLELKGNKCLLGEFLEFKGNREDIQAMRNIRRSKVSRLEIQKTSMFGLVHSKLIVLYYPRDYRAEGVSTSEWKEFTVRSGTELKFQIQGSAKPSKYQLSSVISLSLSA
ncbi:uncharacterized protein LOC132061814 isoform X1 [Lycium ferocissimum]|uniref:uncharacterized protein LOC132061814 isoform X1 n=1 Tax=Lycium ferocissimum TaxID=112874 RepID=UPI002815FC06|nr:uncharacterized protein LOC132061814 isoform X1 [Lycium ferocissimum]